MATGTRTINGGPALKDMSYPMTIYGINEPKPGARWKALFDATWPAYKAWYLSGDDRDRPDLAMARQMLRKHMPELMPTYNELVKLAGGDETAARMLTLWDAPRFLPGCSQAVLTDPVPVLCRNYDYSPDLFEQVVYSSAFTGRLVIGTGDCLWGLLDGMNEDGLAVSLTFGGLPGSGPGFAIPLVVRYLLEVCASVADARTVLGRLPVSMAYNLTMVDATGNNLTAFVAQERKPEFSDAIVATNHRGAVPDCPDHARMYRSVERREKLVELLSSRPTPDQLAGAMLKPPLYSDRYSRSFGTLYTAVYRPKDKFVDYIWPDRTWRRTFGDSDESITVVLNER